MEPKPRRLPRIIEFLGYEPDTDRYDVAGLIRDIRTRTGLSYDDIATKIGACTDTLVNLKNGQHQPTRRIYRRLKSFAATLKTWCR
jgi:ribosome-binding protein aMBF1 (putative translation factor)